MSYVKVILLGTLNHEWWNQIWNTSENNLANIIFFNFVIIFVTADGIAPSGARPSAGTMITNYKPCVHIGLALEGEI